MMNKIALVPLLYCLLIVGVGCKKRETTRLAPSGAGPGEAKFDVCGLITKEEIEAIQGSPVTQTKSSDQSNSGLRISLCYYATAEGNKSVSLAVTETDPGSSVKRAATTYWEEAFGHYKNENGEKEREDDKEKRESLRRQRHDEGEKERSTPPKKIDGIGDEAFWEGNRVGGALYVLKKDAFIRLSLGGADNEETRIEKTKKLTAKALERL